MQQDMASALYAYAWLHCIGYAVVQVHSAGHLYMMYHCIPNALVQVYSAGHLHNPAHAKGRPQQLLRLHQEGVLFSFAGCRGLLHRLLLLQGYCGSLSVHQRLPDAAVSGHVGNTKSTTTDLLSATPNVSTLGYPTASGHQ